MDFRDLDRVEEDEMAFSLFMRMYETISIRLNEEVGKGWLLRVRGGDSGEDQRDGALYKLLKSYCGHLWH